MKQYREVKASERLPKKERNYFVRTMSGRELSTRFELGSFKVMEAVDTWLEELPNKQNKVGMYSNLICYHGGYKNATRWHDCAIEDCSTCECNQE
jgi:hypothetical protein